MAAAPPLPENVTCRYFLHGVCHNGDQCNFSHDRRSSQPSIVCKYFLRGQCYYGDRCRYDHTKPRSKPAEASRPAASLTSNGMTRKLPIPMLGTYNRGSTFTTLNKHADNPNTVNVPNGRTDMPSRWAEAREFQPGKKWRGRETTDYAGVAQAGLPSTPVPLTSSTSPGDELCPYAAQGTCMYGPKCEYTHGIMCEICNRAVLHPTNQQQNEEHRRKCMGEFEQNMEHSFAVAASAEKVCGVCMETVLQKENPGDRCFGILSDCNHVFCLSCIRRWRQAKFEHKVIKACPECRVKSNFVTPSKVWVETPEEKCKLINAYKAKLSQKPCKHFDEGRGECPFNMHCFYKHAYPDGSLEKRKPRPRRRRQGGFEDEEEEFEHMFVWDFIENSSVFDIHELLLNLDMDDSLDSDFYYTNFFGGLISSDDDDDFEDGLLDDDHFSFTFS